MAIAGSGVPVVDLVVVRGRLFAGMVSNAPEETIVPRDEAIERLARGETVTVRVTGGIAPILDELYRRGVIVDRLPWHG